MKERLPPHSLAAERTVLGAALHFPGDHLPVLLDMCKRSDFYAPVHGEMFELLHTAHARHQTIDVLTMRHAALGKPNVVDLIDGLNPELGSDIAPICEQVALLARSRKTVQVAFRVAELGLEPVTDPQRFLMESQKLLAGIASDAFVRSRPIDAAQLSAELLTDLDTPNAPTTFLSTGLHDLDACLGGWEPGAVYVVAGRPGMGKSALAFQTLVSAAKEGHRGIGFTLEMQSAKLQRRLVAAETGLNSRLLERGNRRPEDRGRIVVALGRLGSLPFSIVDDPCITVQQLRSVCRAERAKRGLKIVVVDYLQLLAADGKHDNREQEVASMSRELKKLALELDVAVIACCQLNRGLESRADKHPMLSDLRESGAIEQDADTVLMLYRDEYYNQESTLRGVCEIGVVKNRSGGTGVVQVAFHPETTSFRNFAAGRQHP
jgi:replicative DNA helicase